MALEILKDSPTYVMDSSKGLIIPLAMVSAPFDLGHPFEDPDRSNIRASRSSFLRKREGLFIEHDPETGIAYWPPYASGLEDMVNRAIVVGYLGNTSMTPLPITLLSTIVSKIQAMVGTWVNIVRGKDAPTKKTVDLISRANNSSLGAAIFVRYYMGGLLVDNRGAIGAQVPIGEIDFDRWGQYGMETEPIPDPTSSEEVPTYYALRMTQEAFRENQALWTIDSLHCRPTGNPEWPYWIQKWSEEAKKFVWVLIHKDFGFQILSQVGPYDKNFTGVGQSATWRFAPYCLKHFAIDRMDFEHLVNQPARGIIWVSGLDYPTQFRDQLTTFRTEKDEAGVKFYPGVFFGGSRGENSKVTAIPWVEPPAGYTPQEWHREWVDALAAAFHLNVTHLEVRIGEGAMTQTGIANALESEGAISWMRDMIEMVYNHVAPPRILVQCVWKSDHTVRFQIESFRELSLAISRLNNPNLIAATGEGPAFTVQQIHALMTSTIGLEVPTLEDGEEIGSDQGEAALSYTPLGTIAQLQAAGQSADRLSQPGNLVATVTGEVGMIARRATYSDWVWLQLHGGRQVLTSAASLTLLAYAAADMVAGPGRYRTGQGAEVIVSSVEGETAWGRYDWDGPMVDERPFKVSELERSRENKDGRTAAGYA